MHEAGDEHAGQRRGRAMSILDNLTGNIARDIAIVTREAHLFLGVLLMTVGLFHFRSGRYCDGNSVDYLSCTHPTAYHYYSGLDIFLIVAGIFCILLWLFRRK